MKKVFKLLSVIIIALFLTNLACTTINAQEFSDRLSVEEANAYKTVIDSYVKVFGVSDNAEYTSQSSLVLVEFVDFDNDGSLEMLLVYKKYYSYRCAVYKYYNEGVKCLYSDICTLIMGCMMDISLYEKNDNIYTVIDYYKNSPKDRVTIGTLIDGKWVTTDYYHTYQDEEIDDIYERRIQIVVNNENNPKTVLQKLEIITQNAGGNIGSSLEDEICCLYIAKLHYMQIEVDEHGSFTYDGEYYIYDINKDDVPELIFKEGTCEADYKYKVFSCANGNVIYLGEMKGGHIVLYGIDEPQILLSFAHHGFERIYLTGIENGRIKDPVLVYEEDSTQKEYTYVENMKGFREDAYVLKASKIFDIGLIDETLMEQKRKIKVVIDGKRVHFDQNPIMIEERILVPLRTIFEELGASVEWNGETQTVTSLKETTSISMTIGKKEMYKNSEIILLDVEPRLVGVRTLVPVRAVAEGFDCKVEWDEINRAVYIRTVE